MHMFKCSELNSALAVFIQVSLSLYLLLLYFVFCTWPDTYQHYVSEHHTFVNSGAASRAPRYESHSSVGEATILVTLAGDARRFRNPTPWWYSL